MMCRRPGEGGRGQTSLRCVEQQWEPVEGFARGREERGGAVVLFQTQSDFRGRTQHDKQGRARTEMQQPTKRSLSGSEEPG